MNRRWSRRKLLHLTGITAIPLAGCSALGRKKNGQPLTELYDNDLDVLGDSITYEHDQIRLSGPDQPVALGDTVEFTITNTSATEITLGCHNPWTLQQQINGRWRELLWSTSDGVLLCASILPSGKSFTEKVTLTRSALETLSETKTVQYDLTTGLYRFVILGTNPFLATDFRVRSND
ncbi:immunoglobulin-like domain-containing protein [Haladaptatus caseinilyticus]|uniref:immunoglobulin-like domain-containing protein n=1 Tax=Haladaptatus caseinilyticus TaxID=2993314 RepID=UPI00224B1A9B|nr:immunoglobulin-like domain-containing protein [Haladaptatus caseinilyticus]